MLQASPELRLCADAHEEEVITKDSYEIRALAERDPDIEYIVDIGSNIGCFSIQVSNIFPKAKVIMCEPEPELMKYAKLNLEGKGIVFVEKAIVGDSKLKEVKFNICKWQGNHHVDGRFNWDNYTPAGSQQVGQITVKATTLLEVITDNGFPRIDLLKIDTEGAEPEILKSFKPGLGNVKHVVVEWHSQKDLVSIKDSLWDTHSMVITEGAFKEPSGAVANGNIVAELRKEGEKKSAPELVKFRDQNHGSPRPAGIQGLSVCCKAEIRREGEGYYCGQCHKLQLN